MLTEAPNDMPAVWTPRPWIELGRGEGVWADDVDERSYHSLPLASRSRLEVLRESPALYWARFLAPEDERLPDEDTKATRVGRYTHCAVLEPGRWDEEFVREPSWQFDGRTKDGKAERQAWSAENRLRTMVKGEEYDLAMDMARAVMRHEIAASMLCAADFCERVAIWRDKVTGLLCRARVDAVHVGRLVSDLKTADDVRPEQFGAAAARRGYARQAAMYLDALEAITGTPHRFANVAVHKSAPHEIAIYELDPIAIEAGRKQYRASLIELDRRIATNDWCPDWARQPLTLALPGWALGDS